ncbi:hypothetical protein B296_00057326, partial [Ensete ventricosum]
NAAEFRRQRPRRPGALLHPLIFEYRNASPPLRRSAFLFSLGLGLGFCLSTSNRSFLGLRSGWFRWDDIDDTERRCLPEFFDGSSTSRNPRVYKEYRDFIISKYREDPTKFITFTEIRKSLIGDVGYLHKVFLFLEKWGLINFGAKVAAVEPKTSVEDSGPKVVVEEGPPVDVQVVPACITQRKLVGMASVGGENGFKLPPLTSYSDVFGDWLPKRGLVCGICGDQSAAGGYESFQVAGLSTVAGPQIATAAADAAIVALCSENISATKHFSINKYGENDLLYINNDHNRLAFRLFSSFLFSGLKIEDQEMKLHKQTGMLCYLYYCPSIESILIGYYIVIHRSPFDISVVSEKSSSATAFQVRAAIATALGAVAARAKLLADQEEREIELLMASIIEVQVFSFTLF